MRRLSAVLSSIALSGGLLVALSPAEAAVPPTPGSLVSISGAEKHTLFIGSDHLPYGIGSNTSGQLTGVGTRTELTTLQGLGSGVTATAVSAGYRHSIVIGSDGIPYGTGSNTNHEITGADTSQRSTLSPMTGLPGGVTAAKAYASRWSNSSLVIGSDGIPYVVGQDAFGKLGGSFTTLTAVPGWPSGVDAVDADITFQATFIVGDDGNLYARGYNEHGQGPGVIPGGSATLVPMTLPVGVTATAVEASDDNTFIIGSDGLAYGRGNNAFGEVTYGNDVTSFHEVGTEGDDNSSRLPEGTHVVQIAAGTNHTVLLASNGRLYGTGANSFGQLPSSDPSESQYELQEVGGSLARDVIALAASNHGTFIVDDDGVAYGSGRNEEFQIGGTPDAMFALQVLMGQFISNVTLPTINGTAQFTKTLTANPGTWSPTVKEFAYQWKRDNGSIGGATGSTYELTSDDIGSTISVTVTAKRTRLGQGEATSTETGAVVIAPALAYTSITKPKVIGTFRSGHTVKISRTTTQLLADFDPDATTLAYKWYRGSSAITGATKSTYKLTSKDKGKKIRVRIYGKKDFYGTGSYLTATVTIRR